MPCYQTIRSSNANSTCRDENPTCPRPPHNLSYCKGWSDKVSDVKFWQSTTNADFAPPKARSVPNLLPCLDGRILTRTTIGEPTGTSITSLYKISTSHRDYRPPIGVAKKFPNSMGYREPWETILCRWCGNTQPCRQCSEPSSNRHWSTPPLFTVIGMYTDRSRQNDPACSPRLANNQLMLATPKNVIQQDRLGYVCPPQKSCQDPMRTDHVPSSVTRHDFKSPHAPGVRATRAEKDNYYQRFMDNMCASSHILDRVAEFGTLGGSITQYQDDFCRRLPVQDLQNNYRIMVGCPPLTGNNVLSPYSTCGKSCNI